jgi:heterogeneous nuclear rnp K-like protein 2
MPDVDSNRKRSRSPSDSEQQKHHKRANTGAAASSDEVTANSTGSISQSPAADITMTDSSAPAAAADGNNSSSKSKTDSADVKPSDGDKKDSVTTSGEPSTSTTAAPPSANIHMRCLIVTQDASIIIGKGGSHVNEIREKSGARVMVSESIPGNPERILNVSGPLDAVSKVRPWCPDTTSRVS